MFISLCLSLFLSLLLATSSVAATKSLATLQAQQQVQIKLSLQESETIVPNQQLTLNVDVLSAEPFNGNIKLSYVELDNAVVIQADAQTELNTKKIDGHLWFVQREKINLYPLQTGVYKIPEISVDVSINTDKSGVISGKLTTKPYQFEVSEPKELQELEDYISSPKVEFKLTEQKQALQTEQAPVQQADQEQLATSYQVGSALTYSYQIKAEKVHVLMLPKLQISEIEGVQMYRKPAIERNNFDRFAKFNTATLTQTVTFIFQQQGQFTIPEQKLLWWDTSKGELTETVIAAQTIVVGEASVSDRISNVLTKPFKQLGLNQDNALLWLYGIGLSLLVLLIVWRIYLYKKSLYNSKKSGRQKNSLLATYHRLNNTENKKLTKTYISHVDKQEYQQAIACLYDLAKSRSNSVAALSTLMTKEGVARLQRLQQLAFKSELVKKSNQELDQEPNFSQQDAELLVAALVKKPKLWPKYQTFKFSVKLNADK